MKIFSPIFIFYLLFLSWQPCQDFAAQNVSHQPSAVRQIDSPDEKQPPESDDCSPFCVCSCCQIFTVHARSTFSVTGNFTVSAGKPAESFYQNSYSQQHLNIIWQPPKFNFTA